MDFDDTGKLPGKTKYSGRRRSVTRKSGFTSHPNSTGGEYQIELVPSFWLPANETVSVVFTLPAHKLSEWIGFGLWFCASSSMQLTINGIQEKRKTKTEPCYPDWSKVGSMWQSTGSISEVKVEFLATEDCQIAIWNPLVGTISHKYLDSARPELLGNMYAFAPEAIFINVAGEVTVSSAVPSGDNFPLYLKSCNRCARFLPINIHNERRHLSFSNHCTAAHRVPCSHPLFSRLKNVGSLGDKTLTLQHGYQLECRYCKKFEVNAAHNPQRTPAQMKEDAARRRAFELLLTELYGGSPQLLYRHQHGGELTDDIWEKFERQCFRCGTSLDRANEMHLDHTRPLALLWPLDETATALCGDCNSAKRDRPPSEFYSDTQLETLSEMTGIPLRELIDPTPNLKAIELLFERLDWFFDSFLVRSDLIREQDGKIPAELLLKALQKVLGKAPTIYRLDLMKEYRKRKGS